MNGELIMDSDIVKMMVDYIQNENDKQQQNKGLILLDFPKNKY